MSGADKTKRLLQAVAIIPAETVLQTTVNVPTKKPKEIRSIVPNLIENWAAEELETLHVAIGSRQVDNRVGATLIRRELISSWIDAITDAGLRCRRAVVDAQLLPWEPNTLTILVDRQRALLRWGWANSGALPCQQLPLLLERLCDYNPETCRLLISGETSPSDAEAVKNTLLTRGIVINVDELGQTSSTYFIKRLIETDVVNMLQGELAPPDAAISQWLRWRVTVYIASGLLVTQLLLCLIGGGFFALRAYHAHGEAERLYHELFPDDKRLVNVRQQMLNHINQNRQDSRSPFLTLFGRLAKTIQAERTGPVPRLRSLAFDANNGTMQVDLLLPDIETLDKLQQSLREQNINSKILSATSENVAIVGRLSLKEQ